MFACRGCEKMRRRHCAPNQPFVPPKSAFAFCRLPPLSRRAAALPAAAVQPPLARPHQDARGRAAETPDQRQSTRSGGQTFCTFLLQKCGNFPLNCPHKRRGRFRQGLLEQETSERRRSPPALAVVRVVEVGDMNEIVDTKSRKFWKGAADGVFRGVHWVDRRAALLPQICLAKQGRDNLGRRSKPPDHRLGDDEEVLAGSQAQRHARKRAGRRRKPGGEQQGELHWRPPPLIAVSALETNQARRASTGNSRVERRPARTRT